MSKGVALRRRFGSRVKNLLSNANLRSADLATLSKLPLNRIDKIMKGDLSRITLRDMEIIASALETSVYELVSPAIESGE